MVAEMVRQRIPHVRETGFGPCVGFGVVRASQLFGGVVFNNFRSFDVHMSAPFDHVGWALPETIQDLCDYPFNRWGMMRVTAITGKKNKKARKVLEYIGFKFEGVSRLGLDGERDAHVYGLLKQECKWLKDRNDGLTATGSYSSGPLQDRRRADRLERTDGDCQFRHW